MKKLLLLICYVCLFATTKAQYVNIPDSVFRSYLIQQFPSCFNSAKQLDTTYAENINFTDWIMMNEGSFENLDGFQYFKKLESVYIQNCDIRSIKFFPPKLTSIFITGCDSLTTILNLPNKLEYLRITICSLNSLPNIPARLKYLDCWSNRIMQIPTLPDSIWYLSCAGNLLSQLPLIPKSVRILDCSSNKLSILSNLFDSLSELNISSNQFTILPHLPKLLKKLRCSYNDITNLDNLPSTLLELEILHTKIQCLPALPKNLSRLTLQNNSLISCLPNYPDSCLYTNGGSWSSYAPFLTLCNPLNNINRCKSSPYIQSFVYLDNNLNLKIDSNESPKHNIKFTLSNNNYSYTDIKGTAYLNANNLSAYTITAKPPSFYKAVPTGYTHNFFTYDTSVIDTFALQAIALKDSIAITLTPTNWFARAGRDYPYLVSYENVGTTVLSNAAVSLNYDNSLLNYDSSSNNAVTNSGSNLSVSAGNLLPGQTGSFIAYFKVKTSAVLNNSFTSIASIATNTVGATDTLQSTVRGSYDPNDKQATPTLTLQDVGDGKNIDYTIRFQNTGTDTAFNVVIADTLDSKLLANQVQMVGSSHPCRTTVKDNIIFFEFLDIMLPDSNVNKFGSNGFVSFKIKPVATVTNGTIIPNKAAIYFDYNSPVITKPANTIIQNPLPLQLLNFSAIPQKETDKILVYWNTANEVNTAYFIIETSSNGINFKSVAEVAAKGIGSNSYFYSIDKATVVYVRLKMVDKNGIFTYSNTIKLSSTVKESDGLMVLQNPIKHQLKLNVISTKLNKTNASLMNAQGKIVKRFILLQGHQTIDISAIAAGVYYLQSNEGSKKVVVE